jgi:hypothetical protein
MIINIYASKATPWIRVMVVYGIVHHKIICHLAKIMYFFLLLYNNGCTNESVLWDFSGSQRAT